MPFKLKIIFFLLLLLLAGFVFKFWNDHSSSNARMESANAVYNCDKKDQKGNEEFCSKFKSFQSKEK